MENMIDIYGRTLDKANDDMGAGGEQPLEDAFKLIDMVINKNHAGS